MGASMRLCWVIELIVNPKVRSIFLLQIVYLETESLVGWMIPESQSWVESIFVGWVWVWYPKSVLVSRQFKVESIIKLGISIIFSQKECDSNDEIHWKNLHLLLIMLYQPWIILKLRFLTPHNLSIYKIQFK